MLLAFFVDFFFFPLFLFFVGDTNEEVRFVFLLFFEGDRNDDVLFLVEDGDTSTLRSLFFFFDRFMKFVIKR